MLVAFGDVWAPQHANVVTSSTLRHATLRPRATPKQYARGGVTTVIAKCIDFLNPFSSWLQDPQATAARARTQSPPSGGSTPNSQISQVRHRRARNNLHCGGKPLGLEESEEQSRICIVR